MPPEDRTSGAAGIQKGLALGPGFRRGDDEEDTAPVRHFRGACPVLMHRAQIQERRHCLCSRGANTH